MNEFLNTELSVLGAILAADALRYLVPTTLVYVGLWYFWRDWSLGRLIGPRPPNGAQMRREFALSALTVAIFALNGYGIYRLAQSGTIVIYRELAEYGWTWWLVSLALLIVGHDVYFYVVHRILHRPWWFRHVHRIHHQSVHPTPWAAYAFHPVEALLMAVYLPIALLALPLHGGVIFVFLVHMIVRNVLGHCGVALTVRSALGRWFGRSFVTTVHHHLHHNALYGNYGLYFRTLDRWFGTELKAYEPALEAHLCGGDGRKREYQQGLS